MNIRCGGIWGLMLVACSPFPADVLTEEESTHAVPVPLATGIDARSGSIAGLRVGMTKSQILVTGYTAAERPVMQEGDEYVVMDVLLPDSLVVECWFEGGSIERLRTTARGPKDEKGIGVGDTLAALKAAYPDGRLVTGTEEGRHYANFVHGSRVVFEMDMAALPQRCFDDESTGCDARPDLRVHGVVVHSGPSS